MENSIFIARLLAIVYLASAAGFCLNRAFYAKMLDEFNTSAFARYFGGLIALVAGFLLIEFHNHWEWSWRVVITGFGWAGLIKGLTLLAVPGLAEKIITSKSRVFPFAWIPSLLLGLFFAYFGFVA